MNDLSTARMAKFLLLGLAWLACTGCASFSESRLPKRSLADFEKGARLTAVTYEFNEGGSLPTDQSLMLVSATPTVVPTILQSRVEPIFRRVFVEATHRKEVGEWHVDMYYRETERNVAVTYTLVLFFVASLGFIPAYMQTDLYFEAKLKHNGETVKQYVYDESVATWLHWFVLPWSFSNDPIETKSAILDNMILNLIHDLKVDLPRTAAEHGG